MKQAVAEHPKLYRLCGLLKTSRRDAMGALALLWRFTALYSPSGDIGRHDDFTIAKACDENGDPASFIRALLDSGWLDESEEYRLLIHDWEDHCPPWVAARLKKIGLNFFAPKKLRPCPKASAVPKNGHISEPSIDLSIEGSAKRGLREDKKSKEKKREVVEIPAALDSPEFRAAWADWYQHRLDIKKPLTLTSTRQQIKDLESWGIKRAIAAIRHTISKGWQGLRESDVASPGFQRPQRPSVDLNKIDFGE
jgi:hypothetical protein